ncbi:MAG: hypothetical protein HW421_291 [Ignavibacteria bacterium]|nr:hypothetical protein [Ignavibacteria bacterium]
MKKESKFEIFYTSNFKREAKVLSKKYISFENDFEQVLLKLNEEPAFGTSIGKDCYKIRLQIKSKHKGKSGGARLITLVKFVSESIYLLSVFDKSDKESINDDELNEIIKGIQLHQ